MSGSTISWTPTHAQSRNANQFSVTATNASGSATQSWSVAPSGGVVITAVFTYWTSSGATTRQLAFPVGSPFPAALIPQSDGSFARLLGASNPDGTFSILHVPAGYYWLSFSPNTSFWTSSSNFDAGQDFVDTEPSAATQSTTTIAVTLTGADPIEQGDLFTTSSDVFGVALPFAAGVAVGATTISFALPINSNLDFSQVHTLFFSQYEPVTSGGFSGVALGSSLTQSNVTLTNGAVNSVGDALSANPKNSIPRSIKGTEMGIQLSKHRSKHTDARTHGLQHRRSAICSRPNRQFAFCWIESLVHATRPNSSVVYPCFFWSPHRQLLYGIQWANFYSTPKFRDPSHHHRSGFR